MIQEFRGQKFEFVDTKTAPELVREIFADNYKVFEKGIEFRDGDVIVDVGANEGIFSIMIAKLFPKTRVIAIEPIPKTVATLSKNIVLNSTLNVEIFPYCVSTPEQKAVKFIVSKDFSGGSTSKCTFNPEHHYEVEVPAFSLNQVFDLLRIERCRLMKMDIEGAEYEVLYPSGVLEKTDYFTGELHTNHRLECEGRRMVGLANWISNRTKCIHIEPCNMAE
jgi:FkbM family methyltransferase